MNSAHILSVLSALAAAVWSVWTWSEEQQKERQVMRNQEAALYVNSFLLAMEELQSRLYSILAVDELGFYKKEYPGQHDFGSPAAVEILYRLSQYFGWAFRTFRYGPYTKDPKVIELTREIGKTWESRAFPGNAFRFSIDERHSLGEAVVRHVGDVSAVPPRFEAIPLYQFEQEISDEQSKHAPLYQSKAVRCTLAAIDRADKGEALEGHARLAILHNLLVDLLAYLGRQEGLSVAIDERRKATCEGTRPRVSPRGTAMPTIVHQTRGRIRLRLPRVRNDGAYAEHLRRMLGSLGNVTSIRINAAAASVVICYSPGVGQEDFARCALQVIAGESWAQSHSFERQGAVAATSASPPGV